MDARFSINLAQVAITFATNHLWLDLLSGVSLFHLASLENSILGRDSSAGWSAHSSSIGGTAFATFRGSGLSSTRSIILRRASRL